MGLKEHDLTKKSMVLIGFSGETKRIIGEILLLAYAQGVHLLHKFLIIDCLSMYNMILERP